MRGMWIAGVFVLLIAATGIVAANEAPMAEAGLDQEAIVNSTVYLDAGGSLDPDGEIVDYDWSIETPNGSVRTPDCPSCSLTEFVPSRPGQYNVTVTVTDDDGASRNDTLYVFVSGSLPSASPGEDNGTSGGDGGGPDLEVPEGSPGVSVPDVGSGRPGVSPNPDRVVQLDDGTVVLRDGDDTGSGFQLPVGDGSDTVTVSETVMSIAAADDGQVTYSEVALHFNLANVNKGDIESALSNSGSSSSCSGNQCTAIINNPTGPDPDNCIVFCGDTSNGPGGNSGGDPDTGSGPDSGPNDGIGFDAGGNAGVGVGNGGDLGGDNPNGGGGEIDIGRPVEVF